MQFHYQTTLNGGIVDVYLEVEKDDEGDHQIKFDGVFHECTEVTSILSQQDIDALIMEAEAGLSDYAWEQSNV